MCQLIFKEQRSQLHPHCCADVDDHDWDDPETVSNQILEALDHAERPIIIAGNGVGSRKPLIRSVNLEAVKYSNYNRVERSRPYPQFTSIILRQDRIRWR